MFGIHDIPLFIISGLLLNISPGPDSLLIATRSATQGWRAGVAASLGIGTGTFIHIIASALGLSALLATSSTAFTIVKLIGAGYLFYIGVTMLFSKQSRQSENHSTQFQKDSYRKIYLQGILTNALNPKVSLFFLAFVPQFIVPETPNKALAFIILGCIFNFNGMLWANFLAVTAACASSRMKINTAVATWINRIIGGVFVSFGIKLALAKRG